MLSLIKINNAQYIIKINAHKFASGQLANALICARNRGVNVKVNHSVDVVRTGTIIIDDEVIIIGTHNYFGNDSNTTDLVRGVCGVNKK